MTTIERIKKQRIEDCKALIKELNEQVEMYRGYIREYSDEIEKYTDKLRELESKEGFEAA
jgi:predicted RNase H-like nuclease (RuvC/YqgF family)